jgi:serine/threonine protein kinase
VIKDYEIIRQIGSGGMGAVYLARDPRLDRYVAIKKIKLNLNVEKDVSNEILQRFYREARVIASINHPNIVTIYELGEDDETKECFMVMEYLEGKSLEVLLLEGNLDENTVIKCLIQTCEALSYMHKKNIIHRDIKPGNLIYCSSGILKLTDFGLVRFDDNLELTRSGTLLGSILYMSPEQIENPKNVDSKADIYSLGITAFQLLSKGNFPYSGENVWDAIKSIMTTQAVNINKFVPNINKTLENIIMKAISKNPLQRYKDILELQTDLLNYYNTINNTKNITPVTYLNENIENKTKLKTKDTNLNDYFTKTEIITDFNDSFNNNNNTFTETIIIQDSDTSYDDISDIDIDINIDNINEYISSHPKSCINYLSDLDNKISHQISTLESNVNFISNIKKDLLSSIDEIIVEINKMVKEYNSYISSKNYYGIDMNELKRKIDLKKSILSSKRKEEEFINQKINTYIQIKSINKSRKDLINLLVDIISSDNKIFPSNNIFEIKDSQIENLKENIKLKINNYFKLINYKDHIENDVSKINSIFRLCEYSEPVAYVIRTIYKDNAIEVKLIDDLENNVLLEIENIENDILFANCNLYDDSKLLNKSKAGSIIILKSKNFTEETKRKIKTNNKVYKFKERLLDKVYIEHQKVFLEKLKDKLETFINYYENKLNVIFENFDSMFLIKSTSFYSSETRQSTITKVNKIKKILLDLKKEFESDTNKENFSKKINNIILSINKFPIVLKNIENDLRNKKEQRKKAFQNFFFQVSKLNAKEINNQISNLIFVAEKLSENEIPKSLIDFLKFFINMRGGLPTGKSKNEIVNNLNKEKEFLSALEIDTICKVFNVKYNSEKGFIIKVGL